MKDFFKNVKEGFDDAVSSVKIKLNKSSLGVGGSTVDKNGTFNPATNIELKKKLEDESAAKKIELLILKNTRKTKIDDDLIADIFP
jgi:hypothetical protein